MTTGIGTATARACSNIALIKYWGNRDEAMRLPMNPSISFNLADLYTTTTVTFDPALTHDVLHIDGAPADAKATARISKHLDLLGPRARASVTSHNNFPMGAGIASSAAAFAALSVAMCAAAGQHKSERELSVLARQGSGSASRSVPAGFVAWQDQHAYSIAPPEHWPLLDIVGVVSTGHKKIGSTEGHALAPTSPLQAARVADTARRFSVCERAVLQRDFALLADVIEQDALMMHGVMMTSTPPLMYLLPGSFAIMHAVQDLRAAGTPVAFTIDAGANIHCICEAGAAMAVKAMLKAIPGVGQILTSGIGGAAQVTV